MRILLITRMKKIIEIALIVLLVFNALIFIIRPYDLLSLIITTISVLLSFAALYIPTSHEVYFEKSDWKEEGNQMIIYIPYKSHNMGKTISCALYEYNDNHYFEQVYADIY